MHQRLRADMLKERREGGGAMTEQYQVTIESQLGPRKGLLTLIYRDGYVAGSLDLVGHVNAIRGVQSEDGVLHLFHPIQTAVSTFLCETLLELEEGRLRGATRAAPCHMRWEGALVRREPQPLWSESREEWDL